MTVLAKIDTQSCGCDAFDQKQHLTGVDAAAINTGGILGEGPWQFDVTDRIAGGHNSVSVVSKTSAIQMFTSTAPPARADAVVVQKELQRTGNTIVPRQAVKGGAHVPRACEDMPKGQTIVPTGRHVTSCGIALKHGKPVSFGQFGRAHWLGLPGNPLSVFVSWLPFGTSVLQALLGQTGHLAQRRRVVFSKARALRNVFCATSGYGWDVGRPGRDRDFAIRRLGRVPTV